MKTSALCSRPAIFRRLPNKSPLQAMKLMFILLFVICLHVSSSGHAQAVTLSVKNAAITDVFKAIESQTDYRFFYNCSDVSTIWVVTIEIKDGSVETVLDICFAGKPFNYRIEDKKIFIKKSSIPLHTIILAAILALGCLKGFRNRKRIRKILVRISVKIRIIHMRSTRKPKKKKRSA